MGLARTVRPEQEEAVYLAWCEGLDAQQVAEHFGTSYDVMRRTLLRIRKKRVADELRRTEAEYKRIYRNRPDIARPYDPLFGVTLCPIMGSPALLVKGG
jgi:hypothetical protein